MAHDIDAISLPVAVATSTEVSRLLREVETADEALHQAAIREPGTTSKVQLPRTSRLMDILVRTNNLNLLIPEDRAKLIRFLRDIKRSAPVLHISFSADPSPLFTEKLITWLRQEIHPTVLLQVGLQPNIGAGCVVRTPNKYFDFSLRGYFTSHKDVLMQKLQQPLSEQQGG